MIINIKMEDGSLDSSGLLPLLLFLLLLCEEEILPFFYAAMLMKSDKASEAPKMIRS